MNLSFREGLIKDIHDRSEKKIIEQTNAELLIKLIKNADTDSEAEKIASLGTMYKRTGFHFDTRLENLGTDIKYLKKNNELSFKQEGLNHKLIIGDNYDALQNLLITHKGLIDVIYIDPPYASDSMGNFAKTNYKNNITRDNLLSMLYSRLLLAKELLSEQGVLFISIDERNNSYLKCLCDELFSEMNVDELIWQKTDSKVDRNTNAKIIHRFKSIHESILVCYGKRKETYFNKMMKLPDWKNEQSNPDNDPRGPWSSGIISFEEGHKKEDKESENYYTIVTPTGKKITRHWFVTKEEFDRLNADNRISYPKGGDGVPRIKTFENEEKEYYMDSILRGVGTSSTAKDELLDLFNDRDIFDTPKPTKLIKELIRVSSNKSSIILDFFAGSGTTGQAVLELNKEDNGNRKFILCTNNEYTEKNPHGIAYDVTSRRLKRVMTGIEYDLRDSDINGYHDGTADFKWIREHDCFGDSLNVYEIASINSSSNGKDNPFTLINESCYDLPKFTDIKEKIEWVCNNFEHTQFWIEDDEDYIQRVSSGGDK